MPLSDLTALLGSRPAVLCFTLLLTEATLIAPGGARAADRFDGVTIRPTQVAPGLYLLEGQGGNIAASIGADGTLIVDDQFAPLADRIQGALNELGGAAPKIVVNTHFHGDHTGSNAHFGVAATIVSHVNVRERLARDPELPRTALPLVTFTDQVRLNFNDDIIDLMHLPAGHTDGDLFVWFRAANVVHLGDHFFVGRFPFIDLDSGGSVAGALDNLETMLRLLPADITIIPGHGPLATIEDLAATVNMYRETLQLVRAGAAEGMSVDALVKRGLGDDWAEWGSGFINSERWVRTLYSTVNN